MDNTETQGPAVPAVVVPATTDQPLPVESAPAPIQRVNPLMERIRLPGEIHQLPSGGLFYKKGELDESSSEGEVQIYPMTAIDEIVLRSPDLMFSGEAIDQVIGRCVPQVLQPRQLLAKDIDFILTVLRKVSYGEFFEMNLTHTCDDAAEHPYKVPLDGFIKGSKKIDPSSVGNKFSAKMPNGQIIQFHPMRYDAVVELMQASDIDTDAQQRTDQLIDVLVYMTESVDGITDKKDIHEWFGGIPVGWSEEINHSIDAAADWGPDFNVEVECKDCGETFDIGAPLNPVSFFF